MMKNIFETSAFVEKGTKVMKKLFAAALASLCLASLLNTQAGTLPPSIARDSLFVSETLDWLSIGFNYEDGKRSIKSDSFGSYQAKIQSYAAYLGVDALEWLTLFATVGSSKAQLSSSQIELGDTGTKWSLGITANLWHHDIQDPDALSGRLAIKTTFEFSKYATTDTSGDGNWSDVTFSVPVSYEISRDAPQNDTSDIFGIMIYAGPAVSMISGSLPSDSFSQDQSFGGMGGLDLYLFHNLSIGVYVEYFDDYNVGFNMRFHF